MNIILLEKIRKLGNIGDVVKVKPGFGRNFLIPKKKATAATPANIAQFEAHRAEIERLAAETLATAQQNVLKLADKIVTIAAKAGEEGRLFGSVGTADIASAIAEASGITVARSEIKLPHGAIRQVGEYVVDVYLHSDVVTTIKVHIIAAA